MGAFVVLALAACSSDPAPALIVDLKTDLAAGTEFDGLRLYLDGAPGELEPVDDTLDWDRGRRVGTFEGLTRGIHHVRVELTSAGSTALERTIAVEVRGPTATTIVMTRSCVGVTCADGLATSCLGGRCVQPECVEGTEDACVDLPSQCSAAADCGDAGAPACVLARCEAGTCFAVPDDDECAADERCDFTAGCEPRGGGMDAGPDDAGAPDAGPPDAGPPDVGPPDMGTDAGPIDPCETAFFCNGFEGSLASDWDSVFRDGVSEVETVTPGRTGSMQLRARSVEPGDRAIAFVSPPEAMLDGGGWLRFYAMLPASPGTSESLRIARVSNPLYSEGTAVEVMATAAGWRPEIHHQIQRETGTMTLDADRWYCFELFLEVGDPAVVEIYVDGTLAVRRDDLDTRITNGYRKLGVGATTSGTNLEVQYDDVVLSAERPGC